jgi:hypothetical protein
VATLAWAAIHERRNLTGYLYPVNPHHAPIIITYEVQWRRLLSVAPGNVARFTVLPAFGPESEAAISVGDEPDAPYQLPCTKAKAQIWNALNTAENPDATLSLQVPIDRRDVPLRSDVAKAVQSAWLSMLRLPRRETRDGVVDGVDFQIAAVDPRNHAGMTGETSSPRAGRVMDVTRISQRLLDYCAADDAGRPAIGRDIVKLSNALARQAWLANPVIGRSGP